MGYTDPPYSELDRDGTDVNHFYFTSQHAPCLLTGSQEGSSFECSSSVASVCLLFSGLSFRKSDKPKQPSPVIVMIHKCTGATRDELLSQIGDKQQDKRERAENSA